MVMEIPVNLVFSKNNTALWLMRDMSGRARLYACVAVLSARKQAAGLPGGRAWYSQPAHRQTAEYEKIYIYQYYIEFLLHLLRVSLITA